ncbi:hypothetical protein TWF694_010276 [Orbilia ellipsospora]|uniref:Uncharacterized protein n=1 Tax=Orbilia ellipsospora TaxID=2528407 RepID=A0AAV9XAR2_9PEZI
MRWIIFFTIWWLPIAYGQWAFRFAWDTPYSSSNRNYAPVLNPPRHCTGLTVRDVIIQDHSGYGGSRRLSRHLAGMSITQGGLTLNESDQVPQKPGAEVTIRVATMVRFVGFWSRQRCSHLPTLMIYFHPIPGTRQIADLYALAKGIPNFNLKDYNYGAWAEIPEGPEIFPSIEPGSIVMRLNRPEKDYPAWEGDYVILKDVIAVKPRAQGSHQFKDLAKWGTSDAVPEYRNIWIPKDEWLAQRNEEIPYVPFDISRASTKVFVPGEDYIAHLYGQAGRPQRPNGKIEAPLGKNIPPQGLKESVPGATQAPAGDQTPVKGASGETQGVVNYNQGEGETEILRDKPVDNEKISDFEIESRMLLQALREEEIKAIMKMILTSGPQAMLESLQDMMAELKLAREMNLLTEKELVEVSKKFDDEGYTNRRLAFYLQSYRIGKLRNQLPENEREQWFQRQLKQIRYSWDAPSILITLMLHKMEDLGVLNDESEFDSNGSDPGSLVMDFLQGIEKEVLDVVNAIEHQYQNNPDLIESPASIAEREINRGSFALVLNRIMGLENLDDLEDEESQTETELVSYPPEPLAVLEEPQIEPKTPEELHVEPEMPEISQIEPETLEEPQLEYEVATPELVIHPPFFDENLDQLEFEPSPALSRQPSATQEDSVFIARVEDNRIPEVLTDAQRLQNILDDIDQQPDQPQASFGSAEMELENEEPEQNPGNFIDEQPVVSNTIQTDLLRQLGNGFEPEEDNEIQYSSTTRRRRPGVQYAFNEDSPRGRPMTSFGRPPRSQIQTTEYPSEGRNAMELETNEKA